MIVQVDTTNNPSLRMAISRTLNILKSSDRNNVDIFIDDGLHSSESQINVFKAVFPHISPGGMYITEDVTVPSFQYDINRIIYIRSDFSSLALMQEMASTTGLEPKCYQFHENNQMACMIVIHKKYG